ncbi:MAG: hypothetical protein H7239_09845 [Flavobacterium sp.]|nr:hypothetical protein [Flavobacterium sp.]
MLWCTFFDTTFSIADSNTGISPLAVGVDSENNLYLSGVCPFQNNIPIGGYTSPGIITEPVGFNLDGSGQTGFLAKFSSSGVQQWGKFTSGIIHSIVFDTNDVMYVGGYTNYQTQVGTPNTFQPNYINYSNSVLYYFIARFTLLME